MADNEQQLEALFGELAKFSEYKVGQVIKYRADGFVKTGEITWITAPGRTARGTEHPLEYWIGLDVAYQTDILGLAELVDEPTLVTCPHCGGMHHAEAVERCPKSKRK